jgi:hypothetical protein
VRGALFGGDVGANADSAGAEPKVEAVRAGTAAGGGGDKCTSAGVLGLARGGEATHPLDTWEPWSAAGGTDGCSTWISAAW